ncbi:hypothetical protein R6Q57_028616 [Mikania cordata]
MSVVLSVGNLSLNHRCRTPSSAKSFFNNRSSSNLNQTNCRLVTKFGHNSAQKWFRHSKSCFRSLKQEDEDYSDNANTTNNSERRDEIIDVILGSQETKTTGTRSSLLAQLAILLGIAATVTLLSIFLKQPNQGPTFGIQILDMGASTSAVPSIGFSFNAFGYRVVLPEYTPGWVYFWLLMAAGCGLFISEEALNIWVGISLARMLSLDGTRQSFVVSFSKSAPHILSTVLWVYWGVCISDMIPFYLGRLFKKSGASDDVYSKLGISKEKAVGLTHVVQRYGNLIGFVERFSLGGRNPTAFFAGALVCEHPFLYNDRYIPRVFLCWSLLWWLDYSSNSAWNWFLTERTPCNCPSHCCHCSGNMDHAPICCSSFNSINLIPATTLC